MKLQLFTMTCSILLLLASQCKVAQKGKCLLPMKIGNCRASFPRFYFDVKSGTCREFVYGGCRGNANNFLTMADCRATCQAND